MKGIISFILALFLFSSTLFISSPLAYAEDSLDVSYCLNDSNARVNNTYARGADYSISIIENSCIWRSDDNWIWDNSSLEYTPFIYKNNYSSLGYYQVQTAYVSARIYDYYTEIYNPEMSELRVYDERFEVDRWRSQGQGKWDVIGAQAGNAYFNVLESSDELNITRSFLSFAGWLNVTFVFRENLKHDIIWQNLMGSTEIFRVRQLWDGIVGDRVKHKNGETVIIDVNLIDSPTFIFQKADSTISVSEDQSSMYYGIDQTTGLYYPLLSQNIQPTEISTSAQGMKADFIFSNWTLAQGESLTIDPVTETITPTDYWAEVSTAGGIGAVCQAVSSKTDRTGTLANVIFLRQSGSASAPSCIRAAVEFNTTTIPDTIASVTNVTIQFDINAVLNPRVTDWNEINNRPTTTAMGALWTDIGDGVNFVSGSTIMNTAGNNKELILGSSANSDVLAAINAGTDWWAVGLKIQDESRDGNIHASGLDDTAASGTPRWTLEITYTVGVYITAVFLTGISSMSYNTTGLPNNTATLIINNTVASFDVNISSNYQFWRYELPESEDNHTHFQTYNRFITANYTITAYALEAGGGGVSGVSMLILAVVGGFGLIVVAVASRKK